MKAYLLIDETGEGDYPVGIYSTAQEASKARRALRDPSEAAIREYEVDDPVTHNYLRITVTDGEDLPVEGTND